jgi:hypothetical protein
MTVITAYYHDRRKQPPLFELLTPEGWIVVNEQEYQTAWMRNK